MMKTIVFENDSSRYSYKNTFPHFLYSSLLDYGLTKEQFASRTGMHPRAINRYLPGRQQELPKGEIPDKTLSALLKALDKTHEDLEEYHFSSRHKLVTFSLDEPYTSLDNHEKHVIFYELFKHIKEHSEKNYLDDYYPYSYRYISHYTRLSGQKAKELFGGFIRDCLEVRKWSLEDLADRAGYNERTYRRLLKDNGLMQSGDIKIPLYQASLAAIDKCHTDFVDFCMESRTEFFEINLSKSNRESDEGGAGLNEIGAHDRVLLITRILQKVQSSGVCIVTGVVWNCKPYVIRVTTPNSKKLTFRIYDLHETSNFE